MVYSSWFLLRFQFVGVGHGHAQLGDFFFLRGDERIELRNLAGVLALLVLAETEQIRFVFRTPAVEIEAILGDDGLAQPFGSERELEGLDIPTPAVNSFSSAVPAASLPSMLSVYFPGINPFTSKVPWSSVAGQSLRENVAA